MSEFKTDPDGAHQMFLGEPWYKWGIPFVHSTSEQEARFTVEIYARSHEEAVAMALSLRMRMDVAGIHQIIAEIPDGGAAEAAADAMRRLDR